MNKTSVVPTDAVITTPTMGNRVYCLYRVSTSQQVDHNDKDDADIPMQRLECHRFAERMGWTIIHEEQEEGVSGHKVRAENRDKLQLIKSAAKQGKFDIFLVFMFDRIGRIADETPFVVEWFVKNGIRVWSTKEGEQRFESHTDKLTNYIRFWQADGESEKTSIRTSTRMGQIVEEGYYTGGIYPYGYKLVRQGRVNKRGHDLYDLAINEDEAPLVRFIFDKYVTEGRGAQSIANLLNSMKIKNRSGNNWHPSSIRGMLKNITYIGILRSGESRSQVLPQLQIIDEQVFRAAQEITRQRSGKCESTRHIPLNIRGQSLLAGNVFCGHCGARLSLTTNSKGRPKSDGTDTIRVRYVCQAKTRKHEPCGGQTGYTLHILDGMIDDIVHEIFCKVKSLSKSEILSASHSAKVSEYKAIAKKAQREYLKTDKELQALRQEVVKAVTGGSVFPAELLKGLIQETEQKCSALKLAYEAAQRDVDQSETTLQELQVQYNQFIGWSNIYDTANTETRKMIVAQLIERVDVFRGYELKIKFAITVEQFLIGLDISA
jgi:site-specific DNA recombinase